MVEQYPALPLFTRNLGEFMADLRHHLFPTQAAAARSPHFPMGRWTLNKYENGRRKPTVGYLAHLAHLIAQKQTAVTPNIIPMQHHLLQEINKAIYLCYPEEQPFQNWDELQIIAGRYSDHEA